MLVIVREKNSQLDHMQAKEPFGAPDAPTAVASERH